MEVLIDKKATVEQIDSWFLTPQENRISLLAHIAVRKWLCEDWSRLRLDKRLSQEQIVELLEKQELSNTVVHHLAEHNPSTLISLLDRVKSRHIISLFMLKDWEGLNVLSRALMFNRLAVPRYLVRRLGVNGLYNLLSDRGGSYGGFPLHAAVDWHNSISEVLSLLKDKRRAHHLLSIGDNVGRSVLSFSIYRGSMEGFQSIIRYYTGNQAKLLELAAITDVKGNTSFHYAAGWKTSCYLINIIESTCSLETRGELAKLLSKRNIDGGKTTLGWNWRYTFCDSDNKFIYDWAFDSLTNNRYLLFDFPSVLIMYNTVRRDGANEEAMSLEKYFTDLGFQAKAKSSFTKKELFEAITDQQTKEASRNGQIVALMSHGSKGYINDRDGKPIPLKNIERRMCADSHRDTPKLLILQSYQNSTDLAQSAAPGNSPSPLPCAALNKGKKPVDIYCPRNRDFCILTSTGPGMYSERNTFKPFLAEAIGGAEVDSSVSHQVIGSVKRKSPVSIVEKTSYCHDGFKLDFCIKTILPVHLAIIRAPNCKTTEGRQKEMAPSTSQSEADIDYHLESTLSLNESNADRENQKKTLPCPGASHKIHRNDECKNAKESGPDARSGVMRRLRQRVRNFFSHR